MGRGPLKGALSRPKVKITSCLQQRNRRGCEAKKYAAGIVKLWLPPRQSRGVSRSH